MKLTQPPVPVAVNLIVRQYHQQCHWTGLMSWLTLTLSPLHHAFGSQSLFSDTDSDATQPPSESNYELEPMTVLLSCLFCFYSNFKEIEKNVHTMKYLKQSLMQNFTYQLMNYDFF